MGSSKKSSSKSSNVKSQSQTTQSAVSYAPAAPTVTTPTTDVVTPAVARDIATDTATAQQNQKLARSRLTGIRSTWSSFGGNSSKLGS